MRFLFLLLISSYLVTACQPQHNTPLAGPTVSTPFPLVQDTSRGTSQPLAAEWLARTTHRVLYIGSYRDTLLVQHTLSSFPPPPLPDGPPQSASLAAFARYGELVAAPPHWKYGQVAHLQVSLDTTVHLKAEEAVQDTVLRWFDSYPVLVRNQEKDTVVIGYGDFLPLHVEAKDWQGQWRTIEQPYAYMCGNGLPLLFLPPNHVVLTSVFIPHGSFQTLLRLRFGKTYSPSFTGSIHPHQFEQQPYNE